MSILVYFCSNTTHFTHKKDIAHPIHEDGMPPKRKAGGSNPPGDAEKPDLFIGSGLFFFFKTSKNRAPQREPGYILSLIQTPWKCLPEGFCFPIGIRRRIGCI